MTKTTSNQGSKASIFTTNKASDNLQTSSKMASLLAKYEKFVLPKRGEQIEGVVLQVLNDRILVDFEGKSEGVIAGEEFTNLKKTGTIPAIGEKIKAVVANPEDETGATVLSVRRTAATSAWEKLESGIKEGTEFEAEVYELARNGILVNLLGLRGFIPASFANPEILSDFQKWKGKKIKVTPVEVDRSNNRLICNTTYQITQEHLNNLSKNYKIGQKYTGKIIGMLPFGAVVGFDHFSDFVPNYELSWEKIESPETFFKVGQEVNFVYLGVDKVGKHPKISVKLATPDPWEEISKQFSKDAEVKGKVSKIADFGAFVTFENGVEGLIHTSKIPPEMQLAVGDSVSCIVDTVDVKLRRISLSLVLKTKPVGYR